jgi:ADP-ribosylglycohydrolase
VNRTVNAAVFTDATQLMLFTSDGLVWAESAANDEKGINYTTYVFFSYQYWLYTQTRKVSDKKYESLFNNSDGVRVSRYIKIKNLYKNRRGDDTLVNELQKMPYLSFGRINKPLESNMSNADGLKRVLGAGLYFSYDSKLAFRAGCDFAAITHTNPRGYLAAGVYAAVIAEIISKHSLEESITTAVSILQEYEHGSTTFEIIRKAVYFAKESDIRPLAAMHKLYYGDKKKEDSLEPTAEYADNVLACALFSALIHGKTDFKNAVRLSCNYDGPSEVTAAITGSIVGAMHGTGAIPDSWERKLQMRNLINDSALDLYSISVASDDDEEEHERLSSLSKEELKELKSKHKAEEDDEYYK